MQNKEIIIIIGHGNPEKEADSTGYVADELHKIIHPSCSHECVRTAYLQFMKPELPEAINDAVKDGAHKIIVHPYLLSSGYHVSKNIPDMIDKAKKDHPDVIFIYTEPLGAHKKIVEVVLERIRETTDLQNE
ncbi:MAG: CbiX/SirB N-terminal domain-containing protein [Nitrospiraceae bacterium]|nr:MAG: CbiX/SirB N-terminal domain-containing protein [Nitrospiraceae bacterium]